MLAVAMLAYGLAVICGILLTLPFIYLAARRTERRVRRLEQRARSAERLAELGTLTGGLAHEIKNPLSTVGLNIQLLQEDLQNLSGQLSQHESERQAIGRIDRRLRSLSRETQRLREILEDFLRFAGRMELDLRPVNMNLLVDELIDFYLPQAQAAGLNLRTQLAANPAEVRADSTLLKQALLNLLINATHAMTDARQTGRPHGGASELIVRTERKSGELISHVIDTGPGILPEHLDKIFLPYFTTTRGGTGLGLPTTRRIIEEHGGHIACHTALGRGTDFVISLPAVPADASDSPQPDGGRT